MLRDLVLSLAFAGTLAAPGVVGAVRGFEWDSVYENRSETPLPKASETPFRDFPQAFEKWFSDHVAFRRQLIQLSSHLRYGIAVSSSPMVAVGKEDWLLFRGDLTIQGFRRTLTFDEPTLEAWRAALVRRRDWFAARGIRYLVVFHPNKESIYPEVVPAALNRLRRASAKEMLLASLEDSGVDVLDTTPAVIDLKSAGMPVFLRTDTHWNGLGIYAGYRAIAEHLERWFPSVRPMTIESFHVGHSHAFGGDLSRLLALPEVIVEADRIDVDLKAPRAKKVAPSMAAPPNTPPHSVPFAMETPDGSSPRAVVLGDSFMLGIAPLLAEHFSHMLYYGKHEMDPEVIERERPDVVVEAWVERFLLMGLPAYSPAFNVMTPRERPPYEPPGMDAQHEPGLPFLAVTSWMSSDVRLEKDGTVVSTGKSPSFQGHFSPFQTSPTQTIWVEITAYPLQPGDVRRRAGNLYWCEEGRHFEQDRSAMFPILTDGLPHRYRIRPSVSPRWVGEIANLRLDLPSKLAGAVYRIGSAELVP